MGKTEKEWGIESAEGDGEGKGDAERREVGEDKGIQI